MASSSPSFEEAALAPVEAALTPVEAAFPAQLRPWAGRALSVKLVAGAGGAAVVWLAVFVPYFSQRPFTGAGLATVMVVAAIWTATLRAAFAAGPGTIGTGLPAAIGSFTGLVAVGAIDSWFPGLQLGLAPLVVIAVGVWASSGTWEWFVRHTSVGRRSVLVLGTDDLATVVAEEMGRSSAPRFVLVGRVDGEQATATTGDVPCLGGLTELGAVVDAQRPDIVVLTDERTYALAVDRLIDVAGAGFRVAGLASFIEYAFGRVPLRHVTPAWFMGVLHLRQPVPARWLKRAFDVLVASVGLLLALPLLPIIAFLVWRTHGPIIYRQTRLGEGGRPFTIYKFRTMVPDAETSGGPQWAGEHDERATPIGRFLRRTHLDEIPQFWNVLKGDMSIVGPRPERPEFVTMLETALPFWSRRLLIKPGATGWAQIRSCYPHDCASPADKLSYDLWYIRHRSLAVDIAICLKTAGLVLCSLLPCRLWTRRYLARPGRGTGF
jgi:exopolysaccharide biosynthesis polyprenyl glycosylphosphotransferase